MCFAVSPIRTAVVPAHFSPDDPGHGRLTNEHYFGPWGEEAPAERSSVCQPAASTLCPGGEL